MYGLLDLHGTPRSLQWTTLANTMEVGDSTLTLSESVQDIWFPGDDIVVATTAQESNQTERFVVDSVDGSIVNVTSQAQFKHLGNLR